LKILLDECVNTDLAQYLSGHDVKTVSSCGWNGIKNGELLRRADNEFDVFLTVDQNIPHQQNLDKYRMTFILIKIRASKPENLRLIAFRVMELMPDIKSIKLHIIG